MRLPCSSARHHDRGVAINFYPSQGMVLICDFRGTVMPEICKIRPVVIVSPPSVRRPMLSTIVPLSTTPPRVVRSCHFRLRSPPYEAARGEIWAKCDLIMSVSHRRLSHVRLGDRLAVGWVGADELKAIRIAAAASFGVDVVQGAL